MRFATSNVSLEAGGDRGEARPSSWVKLQVSDAGVGMSEETQEHLFEPFFTTKGPGQGTGLGLATVYGIVREHAGELEVRSRRGVGTEVEIRLPAVEAL